MYQSSPVQTPGEQYRLSVLRAELEDLDKMLDASPRRGPAEKYTSPPRTTRPSSLAKGRPGDQRKTRVVTTETAPITSTKRVPLCTAVGTPVSPRADLFAAVLTPRGGRQGFVSPVQQRHATEEASPPRPLAPSTPHQQAKSANMQLDAILMDEVKQREAELQQLEKRVEASQKQKVHDHDHVKQAVMLMRHVLQGSPASTGEYLLAAQNVLDILEEVKGDETLPCFDDRLRQRVDDHEQAKARILESKTAFDGATSEDKEFRLGDLVTKLELGAIAAEGVKKQHTKKVMALTKELCDRQAERARMDEALKTKAEQLRAAHEALAHTTSQLAAVTDTTKEVSRLQEDKQKLDEQIAALRDEVTACGRKIRSQAQAIEANDGLSEKLRAAELRAAALADSDEKQAAEGAALRARVEELEQEAQGLQEHLGERHAEVEDARAALVEAGREAKAAAAEGNRQRARADGLEASYAAAAERVEELQEALEKSEIQVTSLNDQLRTAVNESQRANESVKELAQSHDADGMEIATMRSTSESLRKELAELKAALKAEEDARVDSQREAAALREKGEELARAHEDLGHKYREKEALESIQQEDIAKKTTQVDLAAKRLAEQEEEMERRERQLNTRELEHKKKGVSFTEREAMLQEMERSLIAKRQEMGHNAVSNTIASSKLVELSQLVESKEAEIGDLAVLNSSLSEQVRSLEVDREVETQRTQQMEQVVELVRSQLQENTSQFGALTDDLQNTRARLNTELAQQEVLEEQVRSLSEANAVLANQNKNVDAEVQRLSIAVDTLELNLQRKSEQLIQQKLEHETEAAHLTRAASEARTLGEHARHQDVILQRNERRIEESKREAASVTETLKELQKDLVHRQARLDDALRNAANLWSAIARLGRKFDEYERIATVQATRPVHDKYEDACSFLRYIRGWWSMYKDKDPSALKLEGSPLPRRPVVVASPVLSALAAPAGITAVSPARFSAASPIASVDYTMTADY